MVRTSVTLPKSLKDEMDKIDMNWSALVREAIRRKVEGEHGSDVVEAVILNERLRRKPPKGWDSGRVIRSWRKKR